jgi:hypothetical protein
VESREKKLVTLDVYSMQSVCNGPGGEEEGGVSVLLVVGREEAQTPKQRYIHEHTTKGSLSTAKHPTGIEIEV